jgi:hypothetical protein
MVVLVGASGGCSFSVDYGDTQFQCDVAADCPGKQVCADGLCSAPGGAQVISFGENQDDDVGGVTQDMYTSSEEPHVNFGRSDGLIADAPAMTALLQIDMSSLGAGDVVAADLILWTAKNALEDGEMEIYAVTEAWIEGDQDSAAGVGNYDLRLPGVPWTTPGAGPGSRGTEVLVRFLPREPEARQVVALPPELVAAWRDDPAANHGLALVVHSATSHGCKLRSSEGDDGERPRLVVTIVP